MKGRIKMPEGFISTGEAAEMLGIDRLTVNRYLAKGILAGEKHPVTRRCKINKESVLALMKKYGIQWKEPIEPQGNSDSREGTDTSGQGAENEIKKHSPHCG